MSDSQSELDARDVILLFVRFPEPGKVKTRLQLALSGEQACAIYQRVATRTIQTVREFAQQSGAAWEAHFAGGSENELQGEFGPGVYVAQCGESLGDRLTYAFERAFSRGARRVIVIGTDCYDLDGATLRTAFAALREHDAVIGPATDGGYYLLGMRRFGADWFHGIPWGTNEVFQATCAVAKRSHAKLKQLRNLSDIDYVDDLLTHRRVDSELSDLLPTTHAGRLSVIIPAINEAQCLTQTLATVGPPAANLEIIFVDGGSQDASLQLAADWGCTVIRSPAGRAKQMNAGAVVSSGDTLMFLHADTRLPPKYRSHIERCLAAGNMLGAFRLSIATDSLVLRGVAHGANCRARFFSMPYGDQALFMRAETFFAVAGYPNLPIMEDVELVRSVRHRGRVATCDAPVSTSARRWQRKGIAQTVLLNQFYLAAYMLGVRPQTIADWYRR
ncbi:MAG: TIGR04283 family arsenosugar biosynthesis glycosyltransferase [Planctomycetales bacterium]|nr:TIGR04283 family arsenosugar biosynthesis glycosyltransferase [Planctomycetales bacterium]